MNEGTRASLNFFTTDAVDRGHTKRRDEVWLAARLQDPTTYLVPVWGDKNLFTLDEVSRPLLLTPQEAQDLIALAESITLLGEIEGHTYFALELPDDLVVSPTTGGAAAETVVARLTQTGRFENLRVVGLQLDQWEGALLAHAKAMTYWHRRHRFCGDCGSPTRSAWAGHLRVCTNPACGKQQFPRTDPAIIVRTTLNETRCLLGRQPTWRPTQYSNVAGFVEPGESLEAAVVREVREETGVQLRTVRYHSSQPWPFPSSLMVGFTAEAASEAISLNDGELEDARWFTRDEIRAGLLNHILRLPSPVSISYRLIEDWFDAKDPGALRGLLAQIEE
jgi:NAD+ diphosphatase